MEIAGASLNYPFIVTIQGEGPGTGQTTARENTAKVLGSQDNPVEELYAGLIMRSFAQQWEEKFLPHNKTWAEFESHIKQINEGLTDRTINPTQLLNSPPEYNEDQVKQFIKDFQSNFEDKTLIDNTIDTSLALLIADNTPRITVVEGKFALGVLIADRFMPTIASVRRPIVKIILECSPETAAQRITKRRQEKGELPEYLNPEKLQKAVTETQAIVSERSKRDQQRYQEIYDISLQDIRNDDSVTVIDTTELSPEEVLLTILQAIAAQIPEFSHSLLDQIASAQIPSTAIATDQSPAPETASPPLAPLF